ncbi:MAG: C40 family peptidase [Leptospiraceae bacterium]|nr:C40 family peptidase [Leptospiraceae bacterium]MDW7975973.1 C40 family peptidase [Leptospiraceae bacterium]
MRKFLFLTFANFIFLSTLLCYESKDRRVTLADRNGIVEIAKSYIGTPYKEGGDTPKGFDCSGFTMFVYRKAGYKIPRTTKDQYLQLEPVKKPKIGDLVFFKLESNSVSHVGIYIGNFQFIHAPSTGKSVEISDLRNPYWRKRYVGSRSYFFGSHRLNQNLFTTSMISLYSAEVI